MEKPTQLEIIRNELLKNGEVSRNWCLKNFISRLGSRIYDLQKEGFVIDGMWRVYDGGKDYVYFLRGAPEKFEPIKEVKKPKQDVLFSLNRTYY